ncbi:hypothetical protein O6H91_08G088000 [Diphasiastrum complanatum]|uniref:Uncharacterized protein n=1 Tax=Diphasiastrum complanatum TaxID=34168 RepID=A0ACC2CZQ7_DIPCM|nr:hypothetical protein O6H91_08G088000 [Diphasiastrum complanatum]
MHTEVVVEARLHAASGVPVGGVVPGGVSYKALDNGGDDRVVREMVRPSQIGTSSQLLAGGVAGAVSKTCTAPLARLTILFQIQGMHADAASSRQASILREASRIMREEGIRAFWKGNGVTVIHRLPYSAVSFFSYEKYKMIFTDMFNVRSSQESIGVGMGMRLLAGGAAGITAATITYPLDLVRTRLAAQTNVKYYNGIIHTLITISRDEGLKGIYRGMGTTLLGVGPNIAINFAAYETLKSTWLSQRPNTSSVIVSLGCGSVAGILSSTATFPIDLVRRRMQLEGIAGRACIYKSGLIGTFAHIVHTEGLRGLYRGIVPEYLKVIPSVAIVFMTYELMKSVLQPKCWNSL